MKLKNALKKIIHSVCLISVLFLSVFFVLPPVESYSDNTSRLYVQNQGDLRVWITIEYYNAGTWTQAAHWDGYTQNVYLDPAYIYRISSIAYFYEYQGSVLSSSFDRPTQLRGQGSNQNYSRIYFNNDTSSVSHYQYFTLYDYIPPTPTPEPTPTPVPATPSPTPLENAEAFFGKLGNDAQNGVGAIMTAWNAASSHFYTGVLFIVIPVFLGIVSLIASFFFGGGDDD